MNYAVVDKISLIVVSVCSSPGGPPTMDGYDVVAVTTDDMLGTQYVNGAFVPNTPPVSLEDAKAARWKAAKAFRTLKLAGGCTAPLGRVQTDPASRTAISEAGGTAAANLVSVPSWSIVWTMADNSAVTHSASQMVAMASAVTTFCSACQTASQVIRKAIFGATTVAAVGAVDITAGYPI